MREADTLGRRRSRPPVESYQDEEEILEWRWRVFGANGSDIVADSAEGYVHRQDAAQMAAELFPDLAVEPDQDC